MLSEAEMYRARPERAAHGNSQRVHLLLSAGGLRCLSYIGALQQLERAGFEAATVSTCSAGTFIGALYCSGLGPSEMRDAVLDLDENDLAGHSRWQLLRRLWSLRAWPYALHKRSGLAETFARIRSGAGLEPDARLGDLRPPLSTAAMDRVGQRLLVYSSGTNPDMAVSELLNIAVAIPFLYPPHQRQGRELIDAGLATHSPVWLATGQREDLPIIVLRAPALRPPQSPRRLTAWANDILLSCAVTQDTLLMERLPRVSVCDIQTGLPSRHPTLSRDEIEKLIECGRRAVADLMERRRESTMIRSGNPEDDRAAHGAANLYGRHLRRLTGLRTPTVFLSYAREDQRWVQRLRQYLGELLADPDVSVWDDSYIPPGTPWDAAIEDAIMRARVAVLLVSRHFVASPYIMERELPLIRERSSAGLVRILWVPVDGAEPPALERAIQGFGGPETSLETMDEAAADRTLAGIARSIEEEFRKEQVDRGHRPARSSVQVDLA